MPILVPPRLLSLLLPGGIILLAAVAFRRWMVTPEMLASLLQILPVIVLGGGLLLSWRFHRSRLFLSLLILFLVERTLLSGTILRSASPPHTDRLLFPLLSLLLPLNLSALAWMPERGLLPPRALLRWTFLLLQIGSVAWLISHPRSSLSLRLEAMLLPSPSGSSDAFLSSPVLWAFGIGLLATLGRFLLRPQALEAGFCWAVVTIFVALCRGKVTPDTPFYLSTAGLILAFSLIETSYHLAYRDELTGLPGRRALQEALLRLPARYTVAVVDVDQFKRVNDRYGHEVGDQVLRMVAGKLSLVSGGGKSYRYGGEEFVIIFPGKSVREALPHLESLRREIEASPFLLRGRGRPRNKPPHPRPAPNPRRRVPVTVSMGVAPGGREAESPQEALRAADQALYRAKREGRNRICMVGA
jgi:GGDEF domain-containing protein